MTRLLYVSLLSVALAATICPAEGAPPCDCGCQVTGECKCKDCPATSPVKVDAKAPTKVAAADRLPNVWYAHNADGTFTPLAAHLVPHAEANRGGSTAILAQGSCSGPNCSVQPRFQAAPVYQFAPVLGSCPNGRCPR